MILVHAIGGQAAGPECARERSQPSVQVTYAQGHQRTRAPQQNDSFVPQRNYHDSHSHERHTVHGLQKHNSHEQDVAGGDGNNGCRLRSPGQAFQPIDKPARYRHNL